jgi:hypothetical protein
MISRNAAAAILAALVLAGCGTTPSDRMLSGGLLGAGAGAAIGSVTGGVGTGAVIGAVSGAALGGLTHPRDIDLGEPIWHRSAGHYHHRHYAYSCRHTSADQKVCHRVASR